MCVPANQLVLGASILVLEVFLPSDQRVICLAEGALARPEKVDLSSLSLQYVLRML